MATLKMIVDDFKQWDLLELGERDFIARANELGITYEEQQILRYAQEQVNRGNYDINNIPHIDDAIGIKNRVAPTVFPVKKPVKKPVVKKVVPPIEEVASKPEEVIETDVPQSVQSEQEQPQREVKNDEALVREASKSSDKTDRAPEIPKHEQLSDEKESDKSSVPLPIQRPAMAENVYETLTFTGNTWEYFKIWIVNVVLSILTLGIYSAWAKVRNNRYFYANTFYKDSSFEYLADPVKILIGRLVIVGFYLVFIFFNDILLNQLAAGILGVFFLLMLPWLLNRAVKFRLRYSAYRNINFSYDADAKAFYSYFLIHTPLTIVTLGLSFPYSYGKFKELFISNSRFGTSGFEYVGKSGAFYKIFLYLAALWLVVAVLIYAMSGFFSPDIAAFKMAMTDESGEPNVQRLLLLVGLFYLFFFIVGFVAKALLDALVANYVWSVTTTEGTLFGCNWSFGRLSWIYLSNFIAILFSLGLLLPWTRIRLLRYKLSNFTIASQHGDAFIAKQNSERSSLGEEASDFFDFDIGL